MLVTTGSVRVDSLEGAAYVPRQTASRDGHESPQFVEILARPASQQSFGTPQGPSVHHQQDQSPLQSPPGLIPAFHRRILATKRGDIKLRPCVIDSLQHFLSSSW